MRMIRIEARQSLRLLALEEEDSVSSNIAAKTKHRFQPRAERRLQPLKLNRNV